MSGLWIAVLGPDGSGKSTLLERVERELAPRFRTVRRYHLRPHVGSGRRDRGPVNDPHARPDRGVALSLAKLGAWWLDYWLGYLLVIRPELRRSALVTFDRYYWDLLADPRRYRFGGPFRPARWLSRWIPRPHVVILLDAPPEVLQDRKREVSAAERARQRSAYRSLAEDITNACVVDAARPVDDVTGEVLAFLRKTMPEEEA